MTGSLQVKKDVYYAVLNFKDENGKRRPKWINTGFKVKNNKREANAALNKLIAEYEGREIVRNRDITFLDYIYYWLETAFISKSIEQNTYESYLENIKRYVEPYFITRKIKLLDLKPMHIQELYNNLLARGLGGHSVLKVHANVHKALRQAVKWELITRNPAEKVTLPKKELFHGNFYTVEQVNQLVDVFKEEAMYLPFLLTAFFGFRRSEVLGLKWSHIDFNANTLIVQDVVVRCGKISALDKPRTKNEVSHRTLPLIAPLREVILAEGDRQRENKKLLGNAYTDNDYVCTWPDGKPFLPNYLSCRFPKVVRKTALPVYRFHDLRHSAASMLLRMKYSLKDIQEWLGHSVYSTTADIYGHLLFEEKKEMATSLGEKFFI